MFAASFHSFIY